MHELSTINYYEIKFMRRELMLLLAAITDYDDDVKIHLNKS